MNDLEGMSELRVAYEMGYLAYQNDESINSNLYDDNEELWQAWKDGYYAAAWDD